MFAEDSWRETFKIIPKLPYKEIGALYWERLRSCDGHEAAALEKGEGEIF